MSEAALLQAIIESPDDDRLRLVYADFLEEKGEATRAEFIRIQLELAKLAENERRASLEAKERELLDAYGVEWGASLQGGVSKWTFRRGFVESIEIGPKNFINRADTICGSHPVRFVTFGGSWGSPVDRGECFRTLAACPWIEKMDGVSFSFGCYEICDNDLLTLSMLPALLERLDSIFILECSVSQIGLWPLVMSPHLTRLRSLTLCECHLRDMRPFAESPHLGPLKRLTLDGNGVDVRGARILSFSPHLAQLESLSLGSCGMSAAAMEELSRSPFLSRLKELYLSDNEIGNAGAADVANAFRGLDYLHLRYNNIHDRGATAIAETLSPSVRGLDLTGNPISEGCRQRLVSRFGDRVRF